MRFMLYEFLKNNYKEAEPIFFSDIVIEGITKSAVNQQLKKLCDEGKLQKYENGIYYLPKKSRLKTNVGVNADMVARYKYVSRGGKVDGFYSGNTFANQLGISTQVPNKVEIVSNNMAAKIREIPIGKRTFIVRRPVVPINDENVYVLQLLDLLKNLDMYLDESYDVAHDKVSQFVQIHGITKNDVDSYIREFPIAIFKSFNFSLLLNALTILFNPDIKRIIPSKKDTVFTVISGFKNINTPKSNITNDVNMFLLAAFFNISFILSLLIFKYISIYNVIMIYCKLSKFIFFNFVKHNWYF